MTSGIQDVSGSAAVTALAYELLTTTSTAAPAALAENGVVTGADYAGIFRTTRNFENLGLPAVDGSMDDGRIRATLIDIVDAIDASAAERLRNRAASERAGYALMLLRLEDVGTGADAATSAATDFSAAVAADATNPAFTYGTVTDASTAAEIQAIRDLTAEALAQAQTDLATENAATTPDQTRIDGLTATIASLDAEIVRLDGLSSLATAKETADSSFFGAIFNFFSSLVSFVVQLFSGGDDLTDVDPNDLLRADGPVDQAFDQLTEVARKGDDDLLAAMLENVDRRALLEQVRERLRTARAEGRTEVDLGPLIMQFAIRFTVEASEGPAPSPIRVPDMRTAALEPLRPGSNAPVRPNGPAPSQQPRNGAARADADAGLFPSIPEAVFAVPGARPSDAPVRTERPAEVGAGVTGTATVGAADAAAPGVLGFGARDGAIVADPLLFDSIEQGILTADELASVLEELGEEPFLQADRALPDDMGEALRRRAAEALAALIESAIAISDAAEDAARMRSEELRADPVRVRLEL